MSSPPTSPALQLTPKSKVQAMLDAIDAASSSDDDYVDVQDLLAVQNTSAIVREAFSHDNAIRAASPSPDSPKTQHQENESRPKAANDEEEDEASAIVKPRGKRAERMQPEALPDIEDEPVSSPKRTPIRKQRLQRNSPPAIASSPSAEPQPSLPTSNENQEFEDDKTRFKQLLAKKQAERRAKEEAAQARRQEILDEEDAVMAEIASSPPPAPSSGASRKSKKQLRLEDRVVEGRLTQNSKPVRKAGKKAQEEIKRETQRLDRGRQLAHEPRVRVKLTTNSFLERMNFRKLGTAKPVVEEPAPIVGDQLMGDSSAQVSSRPPSPIFDSKEPDLTPGSSPPPVSADGKGKGRAVEVAIVEEDEELPTIGDISTQPRAPKVESLAEPVEYMNVAVEPKKYHLPGPVPPKTAKRAAEDVDDLEILAPKSKRTMMFERRNAHKKTSESTPMHHLRTLANLNRSEDATVRQHTNKKAVSAAQHLQDLKRRARQQAIAEKEERIADLKARGVYVRTQEEIEKEQTRTENLIEKARQEDEALRLKEKQEASSQAGSDDEDDEDWEEVGEDKTAIDGPQDEDEVNETLQLSGSEEEMLDTDGEEEEEEDSEAEPDEAKDLVLDQAAVDSGEVDERELDGNAEEMDDFINDEDVANEISKLDHVSQKPAKRKHIVPDDEDDDLDVAEVATTPAAEKPAALTPPPAVTLNPFAGLKALGAGPKVGMTQMFEQSLAPAPQVKDTETPVRPHFGRKQWSTKKKDKISPFADLQRLAPPPVVGMTQLFAGSMGLDPPTPRVKGTPFDITGLEDEMILRPDVIPSSQPAESIPLPEEMQPVGASNSVVPVSVPATNMPLDMLSQMSDPTQDPTQDPGFMHSSPVPDRFLVVAKSHTQSPARKPLQRLKRRHDDSEAGAEDVGDGVATQSNVFTHLQAGAKRERVKTSRFSKKTSAANEAIDQQAEESEDEYHGLGGSDGEPTDSEDSGDEEDKAMLDHSTIADDSRKLAAFAADRERAEDEKVVEKLYHDVTTGGLKRRRTGIGAGLEDLEGSSDEDEFMRKRRKRQIEEAAMRRKLLCKDENVGKLGEKKKAEAFMRTLEDREEFDEDLDFLGGEEEINDESQSQAVEPVAAATEDAVEKQGGLLEDVEMTEEPEEEESAAPANFVVPALPRSKTLPDRFTSRKPATREETSRTISQLLEDPHVPFAIASPEDPSSPVASDGEDELEIDFSRSPARTDSASTSARESQVIDRASLRRAESQPEIAVPGARMAFAAIHPNIAALGAAESQDSFLPPSMRTANHRTMSAVALLSRQASAPSLKHSTSSLSVDGDRSWTIPSVGKSREVASMERMAGGVEVGSKVVGGRKDGGGKRTGGWGATAVEVEARKRKMMERRREEGVKLKERCGSGLSGLGGLGGWKES